MTAAHNHDRSPTPQPPDRSPDPFTNLRVAITGGTSGLGLALQRELLRRGAHVAFVARTRAAVSRIAAEHPHAHGIVGDVSNKPEIHPIALQILGVLGGLDVLVNNASHLGPTPLALLADTDCEDVERALATNLVGPFRLTKALLGSLAAAARDGRGAVVLNVSSDAAINPYPLWGAYGASKAALHHLSRIWNEELAGEGVSILSFDPGDMDTPLHAAAMPDADPLLLKRPETAARELADAIGEALSSRPPVSDREAGEVLGMIAADAPVQRAPDARLLVADRRGQVRHWPRSALVSLLHAGDLVIANDAATLPASLSGYHVTSGRRIEARLAGSETLAVDRVNRFQAVLFGLGDFRMRTEDRPLPPPVGPGDRLVLGPLRATVTRLLGGPRLVVLEFDGAPGEIWEGLARHGRPIQYSHLLTPLAIWDTWTPIAGPPVAFEPPSAGFVVDWRTIASMVERGIRFATIAHAAGISSTGDPELDALLPFAEPYRIPASTARAIADSRGRGGRIVAIGTTVVRALEHAAACDGVVHAGAGLATGRIGADSKLHIVDAIVSGTHEPGSSHHELLRAFAGDETLTRIDRELNAHAYRTHEFGDSVFLERNDPIERNASRQLPQDSRRLSGSVQAPIRP